MRILVVVLAVLTLAPLARAETYLERKDREALATLARSLDGLARDPSLFDGTQIPAGADLAAVEKYFDRMSMQLRTAAGALNDLSAKTAAQPDAQKLHARFDDLAPYRDALAPVLRKAKLAAEADKRKQNADAAAARGDAFKTCTAFREHLEKDTDRQIMRNLIELANSGPPIFWQSVDEGAKYKTALDHIAAACARPEFANAAQACAQTTTNPPPEAAYCALPAKSAEIMKRGVGNLVAHYAKTLGPASLVARFPTDLGWLEVDGVPSWSDYFSGKQLRATLEKRIAPMLVQAGMSSTDADPLFAKLAGEYAALEAKARELAPTWDLPGSPCSGAGCAQARGFIAKWYGSAPSRFQQTQAGWKIVTNDLGVITYREKYGYAMFQVKGDPMCQLREWTLSEQYAGGGRYTPASDVSLGPVRWQPCK